MIHLTQSIEALIFAADQPITKADISATLEAIFDTTIQETAIDLALENLIQKYRGDEFAFEILNIAGGYRFLTKSSYHSVIGTFLKQQTKKKLSQAALETLAVIAYRQPITKTDIEQIRGVNCDYSVQKLLDKELVIVAGRSDTVGKPLLYGTSSKFMDYFKINTLKDLPQLKDFKLPTNRIGSDI